MTKYKEYYYTVKVTDIRERNNNVPIKLYSWFIRNKDHEILQTSPNEFDSKDEAIINAQENIDEYYY